MGRGRGGGSQHAWMRRDNARSQAIARAANEDSGSNWTPSGGTAPQVGSILNDGDGDDYIVSFKQGSGPKEGYTLIADGDYSEDNKGFRGTNRNKGHDDYGPGDGPNDNGTRRGRYTGPGA